VDRTPDAVNFYLVCDRYGVFASFRATVSRFVSSIPAVTMNLEIKPINKKCIMTFI